MGLFRWLCRTGSYNKDSLIVSQGLVNVQCGTLKFEIEFSNTQKNVRMAGENKCSPAF